MTATFKNFLVEQGSSFSKTVTVPVSKIPFIENGVNFYCQARREFVSSDAVSLTVTKDGASPPLSITISLTSNQTVEFSTYRYLYDIVAVTADSNNQVYVTRIYEGFLEIARGVTFYLYEPPIVDSNGGIIVAIPNEFVFVSEASDFGTDVAGVITLQNNYTYFVTQNVDLGGSRLVAGQNTVIMGGSSENARITSTGLLASTPLLTSVHSLPLRHVSFSHFTVLNLNGSDPANNALDWVGVNFVNCENVGTIQNYSNFIMNDSALINSGGMVFDGAIGTVGFNNCLFDTSAANTAITIASTATITRRFRVIYSAFINLPGETAINVSTDASIPIEGYILDTVNFSGGGTYTVGVPRNDNKSLWNNNKGIENTAEIGHMTMNTNIVATSIVSTDTPVKVEGSTVNQPVTEKFTHTANRLTFEGAISRYFKVTSTISLTSGNNNVIGTYIAKNGSIIANSEIYTTTSGTGKSENAVCQTVVFLEQGDFVEVFVENQTSTTNIVVSDLSVVVESLN